MSAICRLQQKLRKSNSIQLPFEHRIPQQVHTPRSPHYGNYDNYGNDTAVRPKKKKKKKKNGTLRTVIEEVFSDEEDQKTKKKKKKEKKRSRIEKLFLENEVSSSDDSDDEPQPWDPPQIMDNLKDSKVVTDISAVIASIKGEDEDNEIVWNHGKTAKGLKSDENLFSWIEAYSAHECRRKRGQDDLIFEDGGDGGGDDARRPPVPLPPPHKRARKVK